MKLFDKLRMSGHIKIFLGLGLMAGGIWLIGMEKPTEPTVGLEHIPIEVIFGMIDQEVAQAPSLKEKFAIIARYKPINRRLNAIAQNYEDTVLKNYIVRMINQYDDKTISNIFGQSKKTALTDPITFIKQVLQRKPDQVTDLLFAAMKYKDHQPLKLVFDIYSPNPNMKNKQGRTLLSLFYDSPEKTKILLDAGADPNLTFLSGGKYLYTPLIWTPANDIQNVKNTEIVMKYLLEAGANPNIRGVRDSTALITAAYKNLSDTVKLLLNAGANPLLEDNEGNTAKDYAENPEIINMLQEAEDEWQMKIKETVIYAAHTLNLEKLSSLFDSDPDLDPNTIFEKKYHKFHGQSKVEQIPLLNVILDYQEDETPEQEEQTQIEQTQIVQLLLNKEADVNSKNTYNGETPLMLAARDGNSQAVQLLLNAGANPLLINEFESTAKDLARDDEIKTILEAAEDIWRAKMGEEGSSSK